METAPNIDRRIKLVNFWLNNLKKGVINQVILLIIDRGIIAQRYKDNIKDSIKKLVFKNEEKESKFIVFTLDEWLNENSNMIASENNIILLTSYRFNITDIKKIQKEVLFIYFPYPFLSKIDDFFFTDNDNSIDITDTNNMFFLMGKRNPLEILELEASMIKLFINHLSMIKSQDIQEYLKNTNLHYSANDLIDSGKYKPLSPNDSIYEEYLLRDIIILKEKAILTSRLSIAIYRKANLDLNANVTEIGRYYSKIFSKSKIVDLKRISKDTSINYNGLSKTKVKAYNVNNKVKTEEAIRQELEIKIKENIARNTHLKDLNLDTIQNIVELIKDILSSYKREI